MEYELVFGVHNMHAFVVWLALTHLMRCQISIETNAVERGNGEIQFSCTLRRRIEASHHYYYYYIRIDVITYEQIAANKMKLMPLLWIAIDSQLMGKYILDLFDEMCNAWVRLSISANSSHCQLVRHHVEPIQHVFKAPNTAVFASPSSRIDW